MIHKRSTALVRSVKFFTGPLLFAKPLSQAFSRQGPNYDQLDPFLASGDSCYLMITFANSLDPDQD